MESRDGFDERGQFTSGTNNYILFMDEFECKKTDDKPPYVSKSVEDIYKTVAGDGQGWTKLDNMCYEKKHNDTLSNKICYSNVSDLTAKTYILPSEVIGYSKDIRLFGLSQSQPYRIGTYPFYPPTWAYCEGLGSKPSFTIKFPMKADLSYRMSDGDNELFINMMFDPFERYAGIDYNDFVYQGNSGRILLDLYEGYAFNINSKAKTCEISGIDLKHEMLSEFLYIGNDTLTYEIREHMKIFDYPEDKVQIFDLGYIPLLNRNEYRLNTKSSDGKVIDITFDFDSDPKSKDTSNLKSKITFDPVTKKTTTVSNIMQSKESTFMSKYSPVFCYVELENRQPDCKIRDIGLTWYMDLEDAKRFNLDRERDNIRKAILNEFLWSYNKFIRKHRYTFNNRVSVKGRSTAVFGTTIMPKVPEFRKSVHILSLTRGESEYSLK
ncbi:hypothetical protein Ciccas_010400 [Cichlidogyrus casuarinus]|uniref:Uncharacterized protein n=1 Tax=Cichlidogyrus casuarinus TaxID=1844966 RepID=A0ABD2PU81_9PLAT